MQIRWGELPQQTRSLRLQETDRALELLHHALGRAWSDTDLSDPYQRRLAFDRLVALRDRLQMPAVVREFERVEQWFQLRERSGGRSGERATPADTSASTAPDARSTAVDIPPYVLMAAADAYLYLRQPVRARDLYREVLHREPDNPNVRSSLFYAYVDMDAFAEAEHLLTGWAAQAGESGAAQLDVRLHRSRLLAFSDRLGDAQEMLESIRAQAPRNAVAHQLLGQVYRWRGWPHLAERELRWVLQRDPDSVGARVERAHLELDRGSVDRAAAQLRSLKMGFASSPAVQRLEHRLRLTGRPQLVSRVRFGHSSGPQLGTRELRMDALVFSNRLAHRVRVFLHEHRAQARLADSVPTNHRLGVGLEYTYRFGHAQAELSKGLADNRKPGLSVQADARVGDHLSVGAALEHNSNEVPLRGMRIGVTGIRYGGVVVYRWHESARAQLRLDRMDISDDNERYSLSATAERRLVNEPLLKLTGLAQAYASRNTRQDVAYFSPRRDLSLSMGLLLDSTLWRHYERRLEQRVRLELGSYWQHAFKRDLTWSLGYEQSLRLNESVNLNYGVSRARRVFDGLPEYENALFATLDVRL
ncbi:MAG: poly-beta-1,6 N-acetyl-D-glucosamine export porin PgaA [Gammaproteobacteria bacterium]|nr:poly-beta-1,6 N-acetyl-D-glucosamine export porin PgaA [Gammaproteobacteria bacterium]